jgi:two-component sensor histidine kinase
LSDIEFGAYLRQLVRDLSSGEGLQVRVDVEEVALSMEQAMPLALVAHELVADALGHAGVSELAVVLRYEPGDRLLLNVSDDGVEVLSGDAAGDGLELVTLFVDQLGGLLSRNADKGTNVFVTFAYGTD